MASVCTTTCDPFSKLQITFYSAISPASGKVDKIQIQINLPHSTNTTSTTCPTSATHATSPHTPDRKCLEPRTGSCPALPCTFNHDLAPASPVHRCMCHHPQPLRDYHSPPKIDPSPFPSALPREKKCTVNFRQVERGWAWARVGEGRTNDSG